MSMTLRRIKQHHPARPSRKEKNRLEERYGNSPGAYDLYGQYGRFLLRQDRPSDAIAKLQKEVQLEPKHPSAYFDLAAAYEAAGRSQEATAEYQKAAQINPACKPPKKR